MRKIWRHVARSWGLVDPAPRQAPAPRSRLRPVPPPESGGAGLEFVVSAGRRAERRTMPGIVRRSRLGYRDALSFSTILLAAAPEELFCWPVTRLPSSTV